MSEQAKLDYRTYIFSKDEKEYSEVLEFLQNLKSFKKLEKSPRHYQSIDGKWMFHLDAFMAGDKTKLVLMDWTLSSRPAISIEYFLRRADPEIYGPILWHLDLFS